ncbi:MAG TPA: protein kinase, partial [Kofleriaceae bacterium]
TVMGTPGYMSPEQMKASKDVDARTDIWALGIVLYECLNGRRPFDAESFSAIVLRAATEPPPPMDPRLPRGLQAVVLRCLEKDRAARFQSMAEVAAALAPFARDRRAAGIVVERTNVMLRGASSAVDPPARFGQAPTATTLSGSAGMVRTTSRRNRYVLGGAGVLLSAIAVLSAVTLSGSSDSNRSVGEPNTQDAGSAHALLATPDRVDAAAGTSPTVADQAPDAAQMVAATPPSEDAAAAKIEHSPVSPDVDKGPQKAAQCQELAANKDWQKLRDCAGELGALGDKNRMPRERTELAEAFRVKAVKEAGNETAAREVERALQEGNLPEAQRYLKTITPDSVYLANAMGTFRSAEMRSIEENQRKAVTLANAHDCSELKRIQAQISASSTPAVADAVAAVKCVEQVASASPGGAGPVQQLNADSNPSSVPQQGGLEISSNTAQRTLPKSPLCGTIGVEDMIRQSQNQFGAGFAKTALQLITKALTCRQDVRMYRIAALYACVAHDAEAAQLYYSKIPAQFRPSIEQRCQQEGIYLLQFQ